MNANLAFASLISAALLASAANAQSTGGTDQPAAANPPAQAQPGAPDAAAGDFVTKRRRTSGALPSSSASGCMGQTTSKLERSRTY